MAAHLVPDVAQPQHHIALPLLAPKMPVLWHLEKIRPNDKLTSSRDRLLCVVDFRDSLNCVKKKIEDHLQILSLYAPSDNSPAIELDGESLLFTARLLSEAAYNCSPRNRW